MNYITAKNHESQLIHAKVPKPLYNEVKAQAAKDGVTLTMLVVGGLRAYLNERVGKKK